MNHANLESVEIQGELTQVSDSAFENCTALKQITFTKKVGSVGNQAFSNCTALETVEMSDGVTSIGNNAFAACGSLQYIMFPKTVTTVGTKLVTDFTSLLAVRYTGTEDEWNASDFKTQEFSGTKVYYNYVKEHEHEFGTSAELISEATCTKEGIQRVTCVKCGLKKEESIPKKEHNFSEWCVIIQPTTEREQR